MSKLLINEQSASVINADAVYTVVLKKDSFPHKVDAGMIDKFIEEKFGKIISRNPDKVNGVTVTPEEIVIVLNTKPTTDLKEKIKQALEEKWQ